MPEFDVVKDTAQLRQVPLMRPDAPGLNGEVLRVEVAGRSHTGLMRSTNEDHYIAARLSRTIEVLETNLGDADAPPSAQLDGYVLAVADGVGGHAAGERASSLVIARGIELILAAANSALKLDSPEAARMLERLRESFVRIADTLRDAAAADAALAGMATTLSVAYTAGLRAFIVHVGDSRAYLFRDGRLIQLTRDHTVAQELADGGEISPNEIRHHPRRNTLTNVIGGGTGFHRPDISTHQLRPNDLLLLCTDGLSDQIDNDSISQVAAAYPWPNDLCRTLIDEALVAGGKDNITVVAARYSLGARR